MKTLLACSAAFVVLWSSVCAAQEQRQRNGRDRQGPGRYSSSPQDMQSRLQRFEAFLRQFDVNGDGTIQPSEIPRERKSLFDRLARRVGLDPNTSIPVAQFREASMRRYSQGASHGARPGPPPGGMPGGPPGSGYPGGVPPGGAAPGMPGMAGRPPGMAPPTGFVATPTSPGTAPVAGFGASPATTPAGEAAAPTTNVSGSPGASTTPPPGAVSPPPTVVPAQPTTIETQVKCQYYARSLLRQFDANRSGALEKEEWEKARPDPKAADRNGDSVINLDELTAWVLESMQKGVAGLNPGKFYRALTPTERLPDGLPDWFARKDPNGDGQVSMAEFSDSWTEETVVEFSKYDLNNDGFITPAECLETLKPQQP